MCRDSRDERSRKEGATRTLGPGARFELASRDPQPPSITRLAHPGRTSPNRGEEYSILLDGSDGPGRGRSCFTHPSRGCSTSRAIHDGVEGTSSKGATFGRVHRIRREADERLRRSGLVVILLGSSGRGLDERRDVAHVLARRGIIALVPEDDFPVEIGPSVLEVDVLERSDVDLVVLSIGSWGAATALGQFSSNPKIAPKLRVRVRPEYHPVHSPPGSYPPTCTRPISSGMATSTPSMEDGRRPCLRPRPSSRCSPNVIVRSMPLDR